MKMFEDQFLNDFIDNAVNRARNNIQQKGKLETEDAIPLMLKSQFNHIAHLEMDMLTKTEFDFKFNQVVLKNEFESKVNTLVTKTEFENRINTLVTKVEFDARISTLLTKTEFETRFNTLVTKSELEQKISPLVTKTEIETRFQAIDQRFTLLQWTAGIGFTFMAFLQTYVTFFK